MKVKISVNDLRTKMTNKGYSRYHKQKLKIQKKYDERLFNWSSSRESKQTKDWFKEEGQEEWRRYIKEISDIMFEPAGNFQQFTWDILSKTEQEYRDRKARGKLDKQNYF
tara:strand:- start:4136 stop:4465 length:330 start_codon:yes stop_codon:yes gene_type:complete